jgi:hypothetical protein
LLACHRTAQGFAGRLRTTLAELVHGPASVTVTGTLDDIGEPLVHVTINAGTFQGTLRAAEHPGPTGAGRARPPTTSRTVGYAAGTSGAAEYHRLRPTRHGSRVRCRSQPHPDDAIEVQ